MSRYQKKHSPTHHSDHHPIFISFFHLPRSIASSLFKLRAWQSFCTTSFHVLFGLRLDLEPSTSYSIHVFTQSVSSFRSTCPYHRNLFCSGINIISCEIAAVKNLYCRKSGPKFTKIGGDLLRTNAYHRAKFHRARPNNVREKRYNFFYFVQYFGIAGTSSAKVHQSWPWCTASPLRQSAKFRPVLKTPLQLLTLSVLLVLNSFMKQRFTKNSIADKSDLVNGHASKP